MTDDFKNIKQALSKLPAVLQQRVVAGATRAAAKTIAEDAKSRVPVDTGNLKMSIKVRKAKKKERKEGVETYYAVPVTKYFNRSATLRIKMKKERVVHYAQMVEFGTSKMAARPFLRPAYEAGAQKSMDAFKKYALERTDKEIAKLNK